MSAEELIGIQSLLELAISKCSICEVMLNNLHDRIDHVKERAINNTPMRFLIGYVCAGHTTTDELNEKLDELTEKFVMSTDKDRYYTRWWLEYYLEYLEQNLDEDLKGPLTMRYFQRRHMDLMATYLRNKWCKITSVI